eukprot:1146919-Pelagomonas_calceolata.AAC.2
MPQEIVLFKIVFKRAILHFIARLRIEINLHSNNAIQLDLIEFTSASNLGVFERQPACNMAWHLDAWLTACEIHVNLVASPVHP